MSTSYCFQAIVTTDLMEPLCRGLFPQGPCTLKRYAWYDCTAGQFGLKQPTMP